METDIGGVDVLLFFFIKRVTSDTKAGKVPCDITESSLACVVSRAAAPPVQRSHQRVCVWKEEGWEKRRDRLNMSFCCCWLMLFFSLSGGREDVAC